MYEEIIFRDYEFALQNDIEHQLWKSVFYKLIEVYRRKLREVSFIFNIFHTISCLKVEKKLINLSKIKSTEDIEMNKVKYCNILQNFLEEAVQYYQNLIQNLQNEFHLPSVQKTIENSEFLMTKTSQESDSSKMESGLFYFYYFPQNLTFNGITCR